MNFTTSTLKKENEKIYDECKKKEIGNFELGYLHVDKIQNKKWHYFDNLIKFHESQRIK